MIQEEGIHDVEPNVLLPTWQNGRGGHAGIGKRLNRFLVDEKFLSRAHAYRSWVVQTKLSDHFPIVFQWEVEGERIHYPFKFNSTWLTMECFDGFVRNYWKSMVIEDGLSPMKMLVQKLKLLKDGVISWEKQQKERDLAELVATEGSMVGILFGICSEVDRSQMARLIDKHLTILKRKEETLFQISRLKWIESGDRNTKFYHQFANFRRIHNHIWDIQAEDATILAKQGKIEMAAFSYFKSSYKAQGDLSIISQMDLIQKYPRMFDEVDGHKLYDPVTLKEIHNTLKGFEHSKSPGPDGWTVDFFLHFFDLIGPELLAMVEESRTKGQVCGALNSTFVALILKSDKPESFAGYRPISLCNLAYKIISKIIAERLKKGLSKGISEEQFGFLENCQITDAIVVAQEALHSVKIKGNKALILKLDLIKSYDRVDWHFIRLVLLQIGIPLETTNWIMGCVSSTNYSILVNGNPTSFFSASRGLRQGCPLSPLLFLLIAEGLI